MRKRLVGLAALLLVSCASPPPYSLSERPTTSSLRRDIAEWSLPFDKKWSELTDTQRRVVRSAYENLPEQDEPPYPENGMQDFARVLADIQDRARASGTLRGAVLVDEHGNGQHVEIWESPDPEINKVVAFAAMKVKYKPGKCSGVPCAMEFPIATTFELE